MVKKIVFWTVIVLLLAIFLRQVFLGTWLLPQVFSIGSLQFHYYGIIMAMAVGAAFYFAMRRAAAYGIAQKAAEDIIFWLVIGGFVGARLYHIVSSSSYYAQSPIEMFKVWNGGLSIYGAVLGGFVALVIVKKMRNLQTGLPAMLDWLTPSLILGQIIGRFGNLFNYEAFGYPTSVSWKMFVPNEFRPDQFSQFSFFHPFFLYEALANGIILLLLLFYLKPKKPGHLFIFYVLLYNSVRFCLEFIRIDSSFLASFRLNAIVSLVLVVVALSWLMFEYKNDKTS